MCRRSPRNIEVPVGHPPHTSPIACKQMSIIDAGVTGPLLREAMEAIRAGLNPHPAGQKTLNVPSYDGEQVRTKKKKQKNAGAN